MRSPAWAELATKQKLRSRIEEEGAQTCSRRALRVPR